MLQVVFFLVLILGLIFHKSKAFRYLLISYILIVMALNNYNPDYRSYNLIYANPDVAQEEIGFRYLCKLGNMFNLSYDVFHFIIVFVALLLFIRGVRILGEFEKVVPSNFYLVSYMLFPMMLDVVLLRSFLSTCIIIYSLQFLYKKKTWKYIFGVLCASTIHNSSIFFFAFLLFDLFESKGLNKEKGVKLKILLRRKKRTDKEQAIRKRYGWVKFCIIVSIVFLFIGLKTRILQSFLTSMGFNSLKIELWLNGSNISVRMVIICAILNLINFITFYFIRRMAFKGEYINEMKNLDRLMYVINYILLINIILMIYSEQFIRLLGVGIILNSIYYSVILKKERKQKRRWMIIAYGMVPALTLFIYRMFAYVTLDGTLYIEYVFKCVLENNLLLEIFR